MPSSPRVLLKRLGRIETWPRRFRVSVQKVKLMSRRRVTLPPLSWLTRSGTWFPRVKLRVLWRVRSLLLGLRCLLVRLTLSFQFRRWGRAPRFKRCPMDGKSVKLRVPIFTCGVRLLTIGELKTLLCRNELVLLVRKRLFPTKFLLSRWAPWRRGRSWVELLVLLLFPRLCGEGLMFSGLSVVLL